MILEIKEVSHKSKRTTETFVKRWIVIQCDNCSTIREYSYKKKIYDRMIMRGYTGCSTSCSSKLALRFLPEETRIARDKK